MDSLIVLNTSAIEAFKSKIEVLSAFIHSAPLSKLRGSSESE